MVAPVTGPYVTTPSYPFADALQRRYRQKRPFNLPLAYEMYYVYGCRVDDTETGITRTKQPTYDPYTQPEASRLLTAATNLAYERLRSQLGAKSGWAENLAQINKTRAMVVQRAIQLGSVASAVRKGRFGEAARMMRTPVPSGVSHRKAAAQNFLEFEYGWKPIFSDLVSSLDSLTSFPAINMPLRGSATEPYSKVTVSESSGSGFRTRVVDTINSVYTVRMGAIATITNPNLFLANQLGVIDFALPWKLIPFSFVVDWFVNVEQCISSVSDWYGVSLQHQYTTRFAKGRAMNTIRSNSWNPSTGLPTGWLYRDFEREGVHVVRTTSISGPVLAMKPFKGFSIQRGAQAISLVLSVLGK